VAPETAEEWEFEPSQRAIKLGAKSTGYHCRHEYKSTTPEVPSAYRPPERLYFYI